jgi:transcriptional regulator GlxA family with amidase domain
MLATTHHTGLGLLKSLDPDISVIHKRFVDNGKFILAAGISAGVDMALYVVGRLAGNGQAMQAASSMEYDWKYHY